MNRNVQVGWKTLRSVDAVDDPVLAAATYDTLPADRVNISGDATSLKLMAFGTGTDNGTALVNLYGGHGQKGAERQPAILITSLTFTLGKTAGMQANKNPAADGGLEALTSNFYFDTVAETDQGGFTPVRLGLDQGQNKVGMALVRLTGESWLFAEVKTLTNITKFNLVAAWVNEIVNEVAVV